jgi:hypothetical protein
MIKRVDPGKIVITEDPRKEKYLQKIINKMKSGRVYELGCPIVIKLPSEYKKYGEYAVWEGNDKVFLARNLGRPIPVLIIQPEDKLEELGNQSTKNKPFYEYYNLDAKSYWNYLNNVLERINRLQEGGIARKIGITASMTIALSSLFFASLSATGNIIGNINQTSSGLIGAGLFLIGIVSTFLCFRKRFF